jgi:hypothetical protein
MSRVGLRSSAETHFYSLMMGCDCHLVVVVAQGKANTGISALLTMRL